MIHRRFGPGAPFAARTAAAEKAEAEKRAAVAEQKQKEEAADLASDNADLATLKAMGVDKQSTEEQLRELLKQARNSKLNGTARRVQFVLDKVFA